MAMSKFAFCLLFICLLYAPISAQAVDATCEGCINFHLCSVIKGYTLDADMNQNYIDDNAVDWVIDACQYVNGMNNSVFYENHLRDFAYYGASVGLAMFADFGAFAQDPDTLIAIKRNTLDNCYNYGYCNQYAQCHDEYGDKYVLTIGNYNWDTGAPIGCEACPGDGTFQSATAPQIGFSHGFSSCGIAADTKYSDTTGTYVYSEACMYTITPDGIVAGGEF